MSSARALAKLFRDRFSMHIAWVPAATSIRLGDYGLWRDGIFTPIGNVAEFGVSLRTEPGREIRLDFVSTVASTTTLAGGARVPALPAADVDAEAQLRFADAESFIVKVARLRSTRITNVAEMSRRLVDAPGWRWTYKVVRELFVGDDVLIVATTEKNTSVTLRGKATALAALQAGSASAGVSVSADKALGLSIAGQGGPVGLGLFRVRLSGAPVLDFGTEGPDPDRIVDAQGNLLDLDDEPTAGDLPDDDSGDDAAQVVGLAQRVELVHGSTRGTTQDITHDIDTTPPGVAPDEPLAFADEPGPVAEHLDPAACQDDPWPTLDLESAEPPHEDEGPLNFHTIHLEDTSTFDRWLQSALKATVAPALVVDGRIGPATQRALLSFQRRAEELTGRALVADGALGPKTIGALARCVGVEPPAAAEAPTTPALNANTQTPALLAAPLRVREARGKSGAVEYVITDGEQEVSFAYWTPDFRDYKPFNVSRYRGARKDLLSDADIRALGYSRSELAILRANALEETGGSYGAINTWDDQIVSWGIAQFAGKAGTLAALLAALKEDPRTAARFERWFVANGLDVADGEYPWNGGDTRKGWHLVVTTADGARLRGNPAWERVRTQPLLLGAFMLAGNDPAIQLGQLAFWRESFLRRAIQKKVGVRAGKGGAAVRDYLTSERGLALIVRLHNWMPAYVVKWSDRFLAELAAEVSGKDPYDPAAWDQELEDRFARKIEDERRSVKKGSYDDYALGLSRGRGSFTG